MAWQTSVMFLICIAAGTTLGMFIAWRWRLFVPLIPVSGDRVDPWQMQRELMQISGQRMPSLPEVNKMSLMYWALILEEAAETGEALLDVLIPAMDRYSRHGGPNGPHHYHTMTSMISSTCENMKQRSGRIRKMLGTEDCFWDDLGLIPDRRAAKALLDGTNDVSVVNAGFCLATGLPGPQGFAAVNRSNLSKKNPDTGVIDKTLDGKWIKGVDYVEPDLDAVLDAQAEHDALIARAAIGDDDRESFKQPHRREAARPAFLR